MDNLTHSLVGLMGARAGLERWTTGATTACILAANLPDIDVLSAAWGPWFSLEHHRGITHSIVGVAILPVLLAGGLFLGYRMLSRYRRKDAGVRFVPLLAVCLIMAATHPLLDWTNNYGIRPFLPWNGTWYYGDLVFVVDPWIWAVLGGIGFLITAQTPRITAAWGGLALLVTLIFFMVPLGAGGLKNVATFRAAWIVTILGIIAIRFFLKGWNPGPRIAQVGMILLVLYWAGLALAHARALETAQYLALRTAESKGEKLERVVAMPTFGNPLSWQSIAETDRSVISFKVELMKPEPVGGPVIDANYPKLVGDAAAILGKAETDPRARVLEGFARFPVATIDGNCLSGAIVHLADLRYTRPGTKNAAGNFSLDVNVECSGYTEGSQ